LYLADLNREYMKMNRLVTYLLLALIIISCRNDDNGLLDAEIIPPRVISEVALEDDATLKVYLQTHFYNYEEFDTPPADFDFKIRFDTIAGDNSDKRPLIEDVQTEVVGVLPSSLGIGDQGETVVNHTLYYLTGRQGLGGTPTLGDNSILSYQGETLEGELFDASSSPIKFYLPNLVRGFRVAMTKLNVGDQIVDNGDGTVDFGTYGIGAVFIPSGLAYSRSTGPSNNLDAYANLVFKLEAFSFEEDTDIDRDGIPSILEDLDGNGDFSNDNTDGDSTANHQDADDDGDGTLTIDEDLEPDTDLNVDRDGDGDKTNDIGDGNPLNDDTDGDGIPNYLDADDTASRNDNS